MTLDDCWWIWMTMTDFKWLCMSLDDFGWLWMTLDDSGWLRMTLDGSKRLDTFFSFATKSTWSRITWREGTKQIMFKLWAMVRIIRHLLDPSVPYYLTYINANNWRKVQLYQLLLLPRGENFSLERYGTALCICTSLTHSFTAIAHIILA